MKAVLIPSLAGMIWAATLAASAPSAESLWETTALPAVATPWHGTPQQCGCNPCRSGALWAGYCAERAAHYAHWRHFWQKAHCAITLGWLPKPHPGCDECCPQAVPMHAQPAQEAPAPVIQEQSEPQGPLPPPPQSQARASRLLLRAAVATQARQPLLRGRRTSWVRATSGESETPGMFRLRWPKLSWPKWPSRKQAD